MGAQVLSINVEFTRATTTRRLLATRLHPATKSSKLLQLSDASFCIRMQRIFEKTRTFARPS
jgi:hypothetical protein